MTPKPGQPLIHLPLVPVDVLQRHRAHIPQDTRFLSAARLLQALWREEYKLPIGTYFADDNQRHSVHGLLGKRVTPGQFFFLKKLSTPPVGS